MNENEICIKNMYKNNENKYGLVAILIHWVSAVAVFGLFALGYWMVDLNYYSDWYQTAPHYHKSVGILLLLATVFRIVWKLANPKPKVLAEKPIEKLAVKLGHRVLYLLLIVLLVSGYLITTADGRGIDVFSWFTVPSMGELFPQQEDIAGDVHEYTAYAILAFAILHMIAALKHHFINKDSTLTRMLRIK